MARVDLTGRQFGRLLVCGLAEIRARKSRWECVCACGKMRIVDGHNLTSGRTMSCGCASVDLLRARNKTHGRSSSRFYALWLAMRTRCYNPRSKSYKDYGGRGISVAAEWQNAAAFIAWCESLAPQRGETIDRIDNDGPYSPENCRFVPASLQSRNKRSNVLVEYQGHRMIFKDFVAALGVVSYGTAIQRRRRGWPAIEAASVAVRRRDLVALRA